MSAPEPSSFHMTPDEFREWGAAAVEWVARYLERVPDLPVLARVEPGEIRSRLPASAPEEGEPFSVVLRDLDEVLLPGMTNWQHPRFFAYFSVTSSEPYAGINASSIPNRRSRSRPSASRRLPRLDLRG